MWYLLRKAFVYYPFSEGSGTKVYNKNYFYYQSLWQQTINDYSTLPSNALWTSDSSLPIICEANELFIQGRCVKQNNYLWFSRGKTNKIVLPLQEYGNEFTWEMWLYLTVPVTVHTENIVSRPSSTQLLLNYDGTNIQFLFYGAGIGLNNYAGLTYLSISRLRATVSSIWVLVSCGNSVLQNTSFISAKSSSLLLGQTQSSAFSYINQNGNTLEISSDDVNYAMDGAVRELRIWRAFRGYTPSIDKFYSELDPIIEPNLVNYWKITESAGTLLYDSSLTSSSASLVRYVVGLSNPNWISLSTNLQLGTPEKTYSTYSIYNQL